MSTVPTVDQGVADWLDRGVWADATQKFDQVRAFTDATGDASFTFAFDPR